jgi:hypothetical protein
MPGLRFQTVRDLYGAFPTAESDVGVPSSNEDSLVFLRKRIGEAAWAPAIAYCAYLLPRREAIWWACQTLKLMLPSMQPHETQTLAVVDTWLRDPQDTNRRAALDRGNAGDPRLPATWLALAAGWSGGNIVPEEHGFAAPPPHQTARAIRAGLMIAMAIAPRVTLADAMRKALDDGLELASRSCG